MKRKIAIGRHFKQARNIEELRLVAKRRLPNFIFEYMDSGAEDEFTLRRNREAFAAFQFVPRALSNTPARDLSVDVFGQKLSLPLVIAPTGYNAMQFRSADTALARAAGLAGIPFTLSTVSNCSVEDLVSQVPDTQVWFQLYALRDRSITADLLARAERSGSDTLVLTVDAVHYGNREWDRRCYRHGMALNLRNKIDVARHPAWIANVLLPSGVPTFANIARYMAPGESKAANGAIFVARQMDTSLSWDAARWIRDQWKGNLIIKGILHPDDAAKAASIGADGIVLSNHGGRQLDGTVAPIEVLEDISHASRSRLKIIVDSGFRRGTDIVKALSLGADVVMIGRSVLYGVAAGGQAGAEHALSILRDEIDRTIAQLGCPSVSALNPSLVRKAPDPMGNDTNQTPQVAAASLE